MLQLLCVLLSLIYADANVEQCPLGLRRSQYLRQYGSSCYEFIFNHPGDWAQAKKDCASRNGHLVSIGSSREQAFIYNSLNVLGFRNDKGIWIGFNDQNSENHWVWESGEKLLYKNWASGQPGLFGAYEDCALMELGDGGKWHDYACHGVLFNTQNHGWVCEYGVVPTSSTSTTTSSTTSTTNTTPIPPSMSTTKQSTTKYETSSLPTSIMSTKSSLGTVSTAKPLTSSLPTTMSSTIVTGSSSTATPRSTQKILSSQASTTDSTKQTSNLSTVTTRSTQPTSVLSTVTTGSPKQTSTYSSVTSGSPKQTSVLSSVVTGSSIVQSTLLTVLLDSTTITMPPSGSTTEATTTPAPETRRTQTVPAFETRRTQAAIANMFTTLQSKLGKHACTNYQESISTSRTCSHQIICDPAVGVLIHIDRCHKPDIYTAISFNNIVSRGQTKPSVQEEKALTQTREGTPIHVQTPNSKCNKKTDT